MAKSRPYEEGLYGALLDPREAIEYLNAALEDGEPSVFLLALRDVTEAHGGIAKIANETELNRQNLYRVLSETGNPTYESLQSVLHALGLKLSVSEYHDEQKVACG